VPRLFLAVSVAAVVSLAFVASSSASAVGGKRLSSAQWKTYQKANKTYTTTNTKAIATFRHCTQVSHAAKPSQAADVFKTCLDGTVTKVTKASTTFGTTLHKFQKSVSGGCTQALNTYIGSLYGWVNVAQGIGNAVSHGQLPSTANAQTAYDQITTGAKGFVKACKPL
jgi:hypothetical protein